MSDLHATKKVNVQEMHEETYFVDERQKKKGKEFKHIGTRCL